MPQHDDHAFINCPFDEAYRPMFDAVVFAVHACGFVARSALEAEDGAEVRIEKVFRLMGECRIGIHDISRTEPDPRTGLPRFNMPFELGAFLAVRQYGGREHRRKICLILEREPGTYRQYCSNIAGQDIRAHFGNPELAVHAVRDLLASIRRAAAVLPGAPHIVERYHLFRAELPQTCERLRLDEAALSFFDYATLVSEWLANNP
jgi:hypothetical protein